MAKWLLIVGIGSLLLLVAMAIRTCEGDWLTVVVVIIDDGGVMVFYCKGN